MGTAHEQREVIRKCVDAEPNQGIDWNRVVKRVANWRGKWAVKLRRYVEEHYSSEFNAKALNREVELLLQGEDPYAAMAAAVEAEAAEKEEAMEGGIKEEGGKDAFEPCSSFKGARAGYCFKMGVRGLGYYRDKYQDIKAEKQEKKEGVVKDGDGNIIKSDKKRREEDVKDEKKEKASGDVKGEKKEKVAGEVKNEKTEKK